MQINVDENVFKVYAISIAILMAKTLIMALLTARQRFKHMVRTQVHSMSMINRYIRKQKVYFLIIAGEIVLISHISIQVFANPEDVAGQEKAKVNFANEGVERVRRCHQNDIENIFPFVFLSGIYIVAVAPSLFAAKCVFYGFTVSRLVHSFVYLQQVKQ